MPYTEAERIAHQTQMFGSTTAVLDFTAVAYPDGPLALALSMLSDAQELIELGQNESARQTINRAKYLIDKVRSAEREKSSRREAADTFVED